MSGKLIVYQGLPGSGKTTKAFEALKQYKSGNAVRVNRDDIRAMLGSPKFSKAFENTVQMLRDAMIRDSLKVGKTVISDDTNLSLNALSQIKQLTVQTNSEFIIDKSLLEVPIQVCVERDSKRLKPVGPQVILDMYLRHVAPPASSSTDSLTPQAIIVDIDGTLAHSTGLSMYDFTKVYTDVADPSVLKLVKEQDSLGKHIIIMTGRGSECRKETHDWLTQVAGLTDFVMYMRPEGDFRPDWLIKTELYNENVLGKYDVDFVLDDRSSVCLTWRALRLKCFQVNYGDF